MALCDSPLSNMLCQLSLLQPRRRAARLSSLTHTHFTQLAQFTMASSAPASAAAGASAETPLIFPSTEALAAELLSQLRVLSAEAVSARGAFHVALSGGSLPATLAAALLGPAPAAAGAAVPRQPLLDTSAWHWWFADERCVRKQHPDSNYLEANNKLFAFLPPIAPERMHAIDDALVEQTGQVSRDGAAAMPSCGTQAHSQLLSSQQSREGRCCRMRYAPSPSFHSRILMHSPWRKAVLTLHCFARSLAFALHTTGRCRLRG